MINTFVPSQLPDTLANSSVRIRTPEDARALRERLQRIALMADTLNELGRGLKEVCSQIERTLESHGPQDSFTWDLLESAACSMMLVLQLAADESNRIGMIRQELMFVGAGLERTGATVSS